jgi:hypothetical protein
MTRSLLTPKKNNLVPTEIIIPHPNLRCDDSYSTALRPLFAVLATLR